MPKNPLSIWSEIIDARTKRSKKFDGLEDKDIDIIERIFRGETGGIHFHQLVGSKPPIYSAYVNEERRLLFIANKSTLALIDILPHHNYDDMKPGLAERFFRKTWGEMANSTIEYDVIACIPDFTPTPDYTFASPNPCVSYHQKFITLDDTQQGAMTLPTPAVIIGDPGCGKSSLCSVMMDNDLHNPALLDDGSRIMYFTESPGLAEKMHLAWTLDHPITARKPEANQLVFANYTKVLEAFGPPEIKDKQPIGEAEFMTWLKMRLEDKALKMKYPFIATPEFVALIRTLYHEFQIITVCGTKERYIKPERRANLPIQMREFAYDEYQRYTHGLKVEGKTFDPNLLLWTPTHQPYSRVFHDEALSASPAINLMLHRLTKDANIIFFADPNQENARQMSDLDFIISELGVNGKPATKQTLGVTYRLPPTIANLANEVLTIKQNLNGGKNEKNQSDHVTCKPDEHDHPGSLSWVTMQGAGDLVNQLNANNQVYVVITHPEYKDEAMQLFGKKASICTIEEARGQEFETAVLYRVTDPQRKESQHLNGKQKITLLQQVHKHLLALGDDLKSKPHLAKPGRLNRRFESYMNSLYIAVSRIVRQGFLIEAGDPAKNELHRRLNACITRSMHAINVPKGTTIHLKDVLVKAEQDLLEGKLLQAKAGYLMAGKTEQEFEAALEANHRTNEALVKSMIDARQPAKPISQPAESKIKPLSEQMVKNLNEVIKTANKNKLISLLKQLRDITLLLNSANPSGPTYLSQLIYKPKLRAPLLNHLVQHKGSLKSIAGLIDFNQPVLLNDNDEEKVIPLMLALTHSNEGCQALNSMTESNETKAFARLSLDTLMTIPLVREKPLKSSVIIHAIQTSPRLFLALVKDNDVLLKTESLDYWFKPLPNSGDNTNEHHLLELIRKIINSKDKVKDELHDAFHLLITNLITDIAKEQASTRLFGAEPVSLFDIMLTDAKFSLTIELVINHFMSTMTPRFLADPIAVQVRSGTHVVHQKVNRITQLIEVHKLNELGRQLIDNMRSDPDSQKFYLQLVNKYLTNSERSTKLSFRTSPTQVNQATRPYQEMLALFSSKEKTAKLATLITHPDGTTCSQFIEILEDDRKKSALVKILSNLKNETTIKARQNFQALLSNIKLETALQYKIGSGQQFLVPTWFFLMDRHNDIMGPYLELIFRGPLNRKGFELLTKPYHSTIFRDEINILTYSLLINPNLLVNIVQCSQQLFHKLDWDTCHSFSNCTQSVLLAIAKLHNHPQIKETMKIIHDNAEAFMKAIQIDKLFSPLKAEGPTCITQFDRLLALDNSSMLTTIIMQKLISESKFSDYINLDSLSQLIELNGPDSDQPSAVHMISRLHLLLSREIRTSEITDLIRQSQNLDAWVDLLTSHHVLVHPAITSYQWSAFSTIVAKSHFKPLLSALVSMNPERLRNLPSSVWHAPVTNETPEDLRVENFALMNLLIRTYASDPIGEYFKEHYSDIYQAAINDTGTVLLSEEEIKDLSNSKIEKHKLNTMIDQDDIDILTTNLSNPKRYVNLKLIYREYPIIDWIMESDKLREFTCEFFNTDQKLGAKQLLWEFLHVIDINHVIKTKSYIGRPLLHVLISRASGKKLINKMLQFDARSFIHSISLKTLTQRISIVKDGVTAIDNPFVEMFTLSSQTILLNFLRYSNHTQAALESLFNSSMNPSLAMMDFVNKMTKVFIEPKTDSKAIRLIIESLCLLFESMPSIVTSSEVNMWDIFLNPALKARLFSEKRSLIDSHSRKRLLQSLSPNVELCESLMKEFNLTKPSLANVETLRQYRLHGLADIDVKYHLDLLQSNNDDRLQSFLASTDAPIVLSLPLNDGKPIILHLLEHPYFRLKAIKTIRDHIFNSTVPGYATLFSEKLLSTKITREGHQIPLLFDLEQCTEGKLLISLIKNKFDGFYSRFGSILFTDAYYSVESQQMIPLCLLLSLNDKATLLEVLQQKPNLMKHVPVDYWIETHDMTSSQTSVISNLLNPMDTECDDASKCLRLLLDESRKTTKSTFNHTRWFEKNIRFNEVQSDFLSLFDLLAYNSSNSDNLVNFLKSFSIPINQLLCDIQTPAGEMLVLDLIHTNPMASAVLRLDALEESHEHHSRPEFIAHAYQLLVRGRPSETTNQFAFQKCYLTSIATARSGPKTIVGLLAIIPEIVHHFTFDESMSAHYKLMLDILLVALLPAYTDEFKQFIAYFSRNELFYSYASKRISQLNRQAKGLFDNANADILGDVAHDDLLTEEALVWLHLLKSTPMLMLDENSNLLDEAYFKAVITKTSFAYAFSLLFYNFEEKYRHTILSHMFKKYRMHDYITFEGDERMPFIQYLLEIYANSNLKNDILSVLYSTDTSLCYPPNGDYHHWTEPAYPLIGETLSEAPSHLDMLIMDDSLVDIAIEFIKTHLKLFLDNYLTPTNLFKPLNTHLGDTCRAALFLLRPNFHKYLTITLRRAKDIPIEILANILNGECAETSEGEIPDSHLVVQLTNTQSGRDLLKVLCKNEDLMSRLNSRLRNIIDSVSEPPKVSIVSQGLFAPAITTLNVGNVGDLVSAIEAMHL